MIWQGDFYSEISNVQESPQHKLLREGKKREGRLFPGKHPPGEVGASDWAHRGARRCAPFLHVTVSSNPLKQSALTVNVMQRQCRDTGSCEQWEDKGAPRDKQELSDEGKSSHQHRLLESELSAAGRGAPWFQKDIWQLSKVVTEERKNIYIAQKCHEIGV